MTCPRCSGFLWLDEGVQRCFTEKPTPSEMHVCSAAIRSCIPGKSNGPTLLTGDGHESKSLCGAGVAWPESSSRGELQVLDG